MFLALRMQTRWFSNLLLVLALLAAQWAGLAHSIEHRAQLESPFVHAVSATGAHDAAGDFLHSCLLFDGLATAHGLLGADAIAHCPPRLAELKTRACPTAWHHKSVLLHQVRARGPPLFS